MLRLAFAMLTGISLEILSSSLSLSPVQTAETAACVLAIAMVFVIISGLIKNPVRAYRLKTMQGLALHLSMVAFAYLITCFYVQKNYRTNFSNYLSDENILVVTLHEPPVLRSKTVVVDATVTEVHNLGGNFKTCGNIQLNFLRDSLCEKLRYGDVLLIKSKPDTTRGPRNPYEYDYKTQQAFHNIFYQAFVTRSQWNMVDSLRGNSLMASVYKIRSGFLQTIAQYVTDTNNFAVASAIMLGYRNYINEDIRRAYAGSGTIHVLSVSGLHVSIMFFMLNFLLQWVDKRNRKLVYAKSCLIILFIWFYACITGLSPPVLRAATMFTLIQLGMLFIRNVNIYNTIAASAMLLMLANPFVITEPGFQLSYLAITGIVYLQPKIANLFVIKSGSPAFQKQKNFLLKPLTFLRYDLMWCMRRLLYFTWQLVAASLAAQVATLPLCLFYFYQLPNLFLISNLVVIPLSNLLLFAGSALFVAGHIPYISSVAGWAFCHLLQLLNNFVFTIDGLPFAVTRGIAISLTEMLLLYLLIVLLCTLTEIKKAKVFIVVIAVLLTLCSFSAFKNIMQHRQQQIAVYAVPGEKAIAFIADRKVYYDFDSALYNNPGSMSFHIFHHWWQSGVNEELPLKDTAETNAPGIYSTRIQQGLIVLFEGREILIVDSQSTSGYLGTKTKLKPDLVIFSGTLKVSIPVLKKSVDFDEVVFDSRCRPASRKRWKKDCADLDIVFWDISAQGAYLWNLKDKMP